MTTDLRQIRWNLSELPLTEAEEYSVWSNHVKLMFLYPGEFYSAYDRALNSENFSAGKTHCDRPSTTNDGDASVETQEKTFPANQEIRCESTCDIPSLCLPYSLAPYCSPFSFGSISDSQRVPSEETCFPWCFYPRMMRHVVFSADHGNENKWYPDCGSASAAGTKKKSTTQESAFFSCMTEQKRKSRSPSFSGLLRHVEVENVNEVHAVCHLAALLRKRNEKKGFKMQTSCTPCDLCGEELGKRNIPSLLSRSSFISSTLRTGDLKVEERQAKFMNDATELLLRIRNENILTSELHHQLERSKLILSQIDDCSVVHKT